MNEKSPWSEPHLLKRLFKKSETSVEQKNVEAAYQEQMEVLQKSERITDEDYLRLLMVIAHSNKPFKYIYGNKWGEHDDLGVREKKLREIRMPPKKFEQAAMALEEHMETREPILTMEKAGQFIECSLAIATEYVASSEKPDSAFNEYLRNTITSTEDFEGD